MSCGLHRAGVRHQVAQRLVERDVPVPEGAREVEVEQVAPEAGIGSRVVGPDLLDPHLALGEVAEVLLEAVRREPVGVALGVVVHDVAQLRAATTGERQVEGRELPDHLVAHERPGVLGHHRVVQRAWPPP